jgi:hypothetical protein
VCVCVYVCVCVCVCVSLTDTYAPRRIHHIVPCRRYLCQPPVCVCERERVCVCIHTYVYTYMYIYMKNIYDIFFESRLKCLKELYI